MFFFIFCPKNNVLYFLSFFTDQSYILVLLLESADSGLKHSLHFALKIEGLLHKISFIFFFECDWFS